MQIANIENLELLLKYLISKSYSVENCYCTWDESCRDITSKLCMDCTKGIELLELLKDISTTKKEID